MREWKKQIVIEESGVKKKEKQKQKIGADFTALIVMSGFFAVTTCFYLEPVVMITILSTLVIPLLFVIFEKKRWIKVFKYILFAGMLAAILINLNGFVTGMLYFVNQLITVWNNRFHTYVTTYEIGSCSIQNQIQFWFVVTAAFYFLWEECRKTKKMLYLSVGELVLLVAAVYFYLSISTLMCAVFACAMLLLFMGRSFYGAGLKTACLSMAAVMLFTGVFYIGTGGFSGNDRVAALKQHVLDQIDYVRYGKEELPEGDMTKAESLVGDTNTDVLEIQADTLGEMHLRGFVGSEFDGKAWNVLDGSNYSGDRAGMIEWLEEKKLEVPYQLGAYTFNSGNSRERVEMSINNVGAYRKYLYLPYEAIKMNSIGGKLNYDWQIISTGFFGEKSYDFDVCGIDLTNQTEVASLLNTSDNAPEDYRQAENVYCSFVYSDYLNVNEEEENLIKEVFFKDQSLEEMDFYQITSQIRLVLQKINTYSETPDVYNGSQDFIEWFLDGNHKCNAAQYATAAAIAYRVAGIPSRYVEGYYLTSEQAQAADGSATLTAKDGHAWTEVYINGIGWMSIEVVPGNYFADYVVQDVAPSPETTVNVVQDNEDSLKGSTADTLEEAKKDPPKKPDPKTVIIYVMGIIILILLILFFLTGMIRLQAFLRKKSFEKKVSKKADTRKQCSLLYDRMWKVIKAMGWTSSPDFPYEYQETFKEHFTQLDILEYTRFISLVQKNVFSSHGLTEAEYRTVRSFVDRITQEVYEQAGFFRRLKLKYWNAL